jgi:hypothetical protein
MKNPLHSHVHAAYLFYYVPNEMGANESRVRAIVRDALIQGKKVLFFIFILLF